MVDNQERSPLLHRRLGLREEQDIPMGPFPLVDRVIAGGRVAEAVSS